MARRGLSNAVLMAAGEKYNAALIRAMSLCAGREQCIMDIRRKLISWETGEEDTEKIISHLVREHFIDEKRYSAAFAKDKFRYNRWGKIKISAELRSRKIPGDIIAAAMEEIDPQEYRDVLKNLLNSHRRNIKPKNQFDLRVKLMRYGLSKGYEAGLLYDLLGTSGDD
jgi:regulatory protein